MSVVFSVSNLGVDTQHPSSFSHALPNGFPHWAFAHAVSPHLMNEEGTELHRAEAGTCIIYPPNYPRYLACPEGCENLCNNWIHFSCSDDQALTEMLASYGIPVCRFFTLKQFMPVIFLLQELIYEHSLDMPHKDTMTSLLVWEMLVQIGRDILPHDMRDLPSLLHLHDFEKLRRQVYANPEKDWNVGMLASSVFLGVNQFISLYRKFFNVTPRQDLIEARVSKAKTLLETDTTLRDVAAACGFKTEYYFSTTFKKVVGVPPGQYAKNKLV